MRQLIIAILISMPFFAASQTSLEELTQKISASIMEVNDGKATVIQRFDTDKAKPYHLTYVRRTIDAKGKELEEKWAFNLADIDKNTVRWEDKKNVLLVLMRVAREQRLIKYFKNGEAQAYTNELILLAKGIDNARELEANFEEAILPAQAVWEKEIDINGRQPSELFDMLFKYVGEVQYGDKVAKQTLGLEGSNEYPDRLRLHVETFNAKGASASETYSWSIGDLNEQSVRLSVRNERVMVEAKTQRNIRWIKTEKDGEQGNFENNLEILVSDPDQGKMVQILLEKLIPFGQEQIKNRLPQTSSSAETLSLLAGTQQKFSSDKSELDQSIKTDCQSMLTFKETGEKKNEVEEYEFHFGDLNERSVALQIKGKNIIVEAGTIERNKFIGYAENGEGKNFKNNIDFRFADVEQARLFEYLLPVAASQCRQAPEVKDLEWLKKSLAESEQTQAGLIQKLEQQTADSECKWKFTSIETSEKKTKEEVSEFNLYDLDPNQANINVSGRTISLGLKTKFNQKIISHYENGKPSYTSALEIVMPNLESAKIAHATILALIENCKQ